ncbi:efflux RND transporter periplasmic adaptor subunit [Pseudomonas piscis]|uniref:HlyD family efflux transporter periplasmic adaptor subunit n=1 Tax=Pseudomonas piscis TaxID=2614538 RepID=A0A7X1PNF8_9PSED|nr:HlyD family efflux transporter periplasmic adaptor subunit [Pseudomonas piscis]MQA55451.1 HlyD family efflux transporter periplasmic adaptor subunit [Pseudomonas piscis]
MTDASPTPTPAKSRRGLNFLIITLVALALILVAGAWWLLYGRLYESTDNAYVRGDVILVSAQARGTATAVHIQNTDTVKAGDALVEIDPVDARLGLDAATHQLALTVRAVNSLYAEENDLAAQVKLRQAEASRASQDLQRRRAVIAQGGVSGEDLHHAEEAAQVAQSGVRAAEAKLAALQARIQGTTVENHPQVSAAAERVREAYLALARTKVPAPADGLITKRAVQVGQHIEPGTVLMGLVPLDKVWVEANFKESQLGQIKVGQAVELFADLYGQKVTYHGRIQGIEAGSGAAFATIPAQNATGNWIKVVQRVPVRIALDREEVLRHPLRIGLSMTVKAILGEPGEQPAQAKVQDSTGVYDNLEQGSQALVEQIIAQNLQASKLSLSRNER